MGRILPPNGIQEMPNIVQMTPMNDIQILCLMAAQSHKEDPEEAVNWGIEVMAYACFRKKQQAVDKRMRELEIAQE